MHLPRSEVPRARSSLTRLLLTSEPTAMRRDKPNLHRCTEFTKFSFLSARTCAHVPMASRDLLLRLRQSYPGQDAEIAYPRPLGLP